MDVARIEALAAELAAEKAARVASGADARIDRLVGVIEQQGAQIAELSVHVGMLVQAVAQLLGEELGTPVPEGEDPRRDLDGNPY